MSCRARSTCRLTSRDGCLGLQQQLSSLTALSAPPHPPCRYSSHSYLGLATLSLLGFQYLLAVYSYLFPKLPLARRRALGPLHAFLGKGILAAGLATMAVRRQLVGRAG